MFDMENRGNVRKFADIVDKVNPPSPHKSDPPEYLDVAERFSFNLGNAIQYLWRASESEQDTEDLQKAVEYLNREIRRRKKSI